MFTIDTNGNITVEPDILMIPEFKTIWMKDKDKDKKNALNDFAFIYYTIDFKSPYVKTYSGDELIERVIADFMPEGFKVDTRIKTAIEKYEELQHTKVLKLFEAADSALNQVYKYLKDFKIDGLSDDKKDDIVAKVLKNIKEVPEIGSRLESARKAVERELSNTTKSKGQRTIRTRELPKQRRK